MQEASQATKYHSQLKKMSDKWQILYLTLIHKSKLGESVRYLHARHQQTAWSAA